MKKEKLEQRMYGFVPYNLSDIQKGIQFGHAVVEYQLKYGKDQEYLSWAKNDKTFIILNGGTTNDVSGTLNALQNDLKALKIKFATFREPDLNNALTGIVFLLDEKVWNKEKYIYSEEECPFDLENPISLTKEEKKNLEIRNFIKNFRLA
jgi:hypothetical protein